MSAATNPYAGWWTERRLARYGWVLYGRAPFTEHVPSLIAAIGSTLYERMDLGQMIYVRRVED